MFKIRHTFRTKTGKTKTQKIDALEAIQLKCYDCCGFSKKEVILCEAKTCPLWPFRHNLIIDEYFSKKY